MGRVYGIPQGLVPTVAVEAVMAWLDAGQPDPATAASRVGQAVYGVIEAARTVAAGSLFPFKRV